jgi:hypothetical protein
MKRHYGVIAPLLVTLSTGTMAIAQSTASSAEKSAATATTDKEKSGSATTGGSSTTTGGSSTTTANKTTNSAATKGKSGDSSQKNTDQSAGKGSQPTQFVYTETIVFDIIDRSQKITFEPGSATLSQEQSTKIRDFVRNMKQAGDVKKFFLAAWANQDYPATGTLSDDQKNVAQLRADTVEQAMKQANAGEVESFLMIERPNWFQRLFVTEGAEIKGTTQTGMFTDEEVVRLGERLRAKGGPNTAVMGAIFEAPTPATAD